MPFCIIPSETELNPIESPSPLADGTDGNVTPAIIQSYLNVLTMKQFNNFILHSCEEDTTYSLYRSYFEDQIENKNKAYSVVTSFSKNKDTRNHTEKEYTIVCVTPNSILSSKDYVLSTGVDTLFWVAGASSACSLNTTLMNREYDGELELLTETVDQGQLEEDIEQGYFAIHRAGDIDVVLSDINNYTKTRPEKGNVFKKNQTIRIIQYLKNQIGTLFNTKYLGKVPNDDLGRIELWNDFVKIAQNLRSQQAIQNFNPIDITVSPIESDATAVYSVWNLSIALVMEKLYLVLKLV